jgi:hypothetical protein
MMVIFGAFRASSDVEVPSGRIPEPVRSCVRNYNRSGVRLVEHVIELLQTINGGTDNFLPPATRATRVEHMFDYCRV